MNYRQYLILATILFCYGCKPELKIEGLWGVISVKVGEQEMTPNARWVRINPNGTQESGNGWFQHSIGTWETTDDQLKMINTNGLEDGYGGFQYRLIDQEMIWKREEENQSVEILLKRASKLPKTYADQLLGLWQLEEASGSGNYFSDTVKPQDYLYFGWDRRFLINTSLGKFRGVYHVNGHRPLVEFIPNDENLIRNRWEIDFQEDGITLTEMNTATSTTRKFKRIYVFPE